MERQRSFAQAEYAQKKKKTRRERFLNEMEQVVPWARLVACIEPITSRERGRKPVGIERMLRMYFLQQWYALADEALEDALYDSQAMRSFVGIDLNVESVPDATTLLKFRRILERHALTQKILDEVNAHLASQPPHAGRNHRGCDHHRRALLHQERKQARPEMHQVKKGNQWHFGMKAHVGTDADSGLVHTVICTGANVADIHCARRSCTERRRWLTRMPAIPASRSVKRPPAGLGVERGWWPSSGGKSSGWRKGRSRR